MNILSIQSHVAYGHAGNASAVFPMQRLGHEVWAVNTVQFSNHTGYGAWRGQVFSGDEVREVVAGIAERGALARCNGVLSGYMGDAGIGEAILEAAAMAKAANADALYCCDPVIGDVGRGIFVRPGIPEFMRDRAVPMADIVTPNHFELEFLTSRTILTLPEAREAVAALRVRGPKIVLVTSLTLDDTPDDAVDLLAAAGSELLRLRTPKLPISVNGAGDMIAALFFVHLLSGAGLAGALARAASSTFGVLERTAAAGSREILSIDAQDEIVTPTRLFAVEEVTLVTSAA
jgi:pyridoxine kinase